MNESTQYVVKIGEYHVFTGQTEEEAQEFLAGQPTITKTVRTWDSDDLADMNMETTESDIPVAQ